MKFKVFAFFAILVSLLIAGCDSKEETSEKKLANNQNTVEKVSEKIQKDFSLKTHDGKIIEAKITEDGMIFKGYEDKAVLLNFFATWCEPCKAEIPHLNNLREKYAGKFEVIAVLLEEDKDPQVLNEFIQKYAMTFPVTNSYDNFLFADAMGGIKTIPTMYMYAKGGKLMQRFVGIVPEEMLESDIKKGLGI